MTKVQAIMKFFEMPTQKAIVEIKALSPSEKDELGTLALEALGEVETDHTGKPLPTGKEA